MDFIREYWAPISAGILAILRIVESVMVEVNNKTGITIVGVIKQFFTLG